MRQKNSPYGSWKSPITTDLVVAGVIKFGDVVIDGDNVYWIEMRPEEGGRHVVVKYTPNGDVKDITPQEFNVRTRVHEYGGGSFTVFNDTVYFSNYSDQRMYCQNDTSAPFALTTAKNIRFADAIVDAKRDRIICVCEDHSETAREAFNSIVSLSLEGGEQDPLVLISGNDFYSNPRLSRDGKKLAWLTWNHPNMPWDGTELWLADIDDNGFPFNPIKVAGSEDESIFQPEWAPDGTLYFVSDKSGWWNLYKYKNGHIAALYVKDAEFGRPQWVFGISTYAFISAEMMICSYTKRGVWNLAILNTGTGELDEIELLYTDITNLKIADGRAFFIGGSPLELASMVQIDLYTKKINILRRSNNADIDPDYLSIPEEISFTNTEGLNAYAFYYPPNNPEHNGMHGERPPLLVMNHGGPTSATSTTLSLAIQYWTTRGIAVLDVNYSGSTGYGRSFMKRLEGNWGVLDYIDCVSAAQSIIEHGDADPKRTAIKGGSAGGYTTLCALTFSDIFSAGASYYGVSDLELLTKETHKFESHYLDRLIGPYPEKIDLYKQRSPINYLDNLKKPVIFFQGLEDKIVPPDQAEIMMTSLKEKGVPVALIEFEKEQHGFRIAENIKRTLEAELYFYSKIFAFNLPEPLTPVKIYNL